MIHIFIQSHSKIIQLSFKNHILLKKKVLMYGRRNDNQLFPVNFKLAQFVVILLRYLT